MRILFYIGAIFSLAACASLTEEQLEAREYRNADWENKFADYRVRCARVGGRVLIYAHSGSIGNDGVPMRGDYYTCSKRLSKN